VPEAWAHASLIGAEPADGVVLAPTAGTLTLTFNETVAAVGSCASSGPMERQSRRREGGERDRCADATRIA